MPKGRYWTGEEVGKLVETYETNMLCGKIANELNRSVQAVRDKAQSLGLSRPCWWTDNETVLLRKLYKTKMPISEIAARIGRTESRVKNKGWWLGLRREGKPDREAKMKDWVKKADMAEVKALQLLKDAGYSDVKRTHDFVMSQDPADLTYSTQGLTVGVNVKSSVLSITLSNLKRMMKLYDTVEFLWETDKEWYHFRLIGSFEKECESDTL